MPDKPFTYEILTDKGFHLSRYDTHIQRKLSSMQGQFLDQRAYQAMLAKQDTILYEVYEVSRPAAEGELIQGLSIVHPGTVGEEYFMTKGHFHSLLEAAEVYYCLGGKGFMVMETPEGEWAVEPLQPQTALYVPPRWAHRLVNTQPDEDLVIYFVYPGNAGHDYGTIERQGTRKLILKRDNKPTIVDNPRWLPPDQR